MPRLHIYCLKDQQEVYARECEATYGQFLDHIATHIAHTKLKTRMGSNRLARQLFGMLKLRKDCILFELQMYACGRRKNKEDEQNRNFQV